MNQPARAISDIEEKGGLKASLIGILRMSINPTGTYAEMSDDLQEEGLRTIAKALQPSSLLIRSMV
jgi:hypothetical protein